MWSTVSHNLRAFSSQVSRTSYRGFSTTLLREYSIWYRVRSSTYLLCDSGLVFYRFFLLRALSFRLPTTADWMHMTSSQTVMEHFGTFTPPRLPATSAFALVIFCLRGPPADSTVFLSGLNVSLLQVLQCLHKRLLSRIPLSSWTVMRWPVSFGRKYERRFGPMFHCRAITLKISISSSYRISNSISNTSI